MKRQGRNPTLNARDLRSLRQHCIKNHHYCVEDFTLWAQEHFRKLLLANTVRCYICQCKVKLTKQKPYINNIRKCRRILWAPTRLKWTDTKWKKCAVVWLVHVSNCFWKSWTSWHKREKTIQIVSTQSSEASICDGMVGVLVPTWAAHTPVMAPSMLERTSRFGNNTCCNEHQISCHCSVLNWKKG